MSLITEKAGLKSQVNRYLTLLSSLEPAPVDLIEEMQYFKGLVEFADPSELESLQGDWSEIRPKDRRSMAYILDRDISKLPTPQKNVFRAILALRGAVSPGNPEQRAQSKKKEVSGGAVAVESQDATKNNEATINRAGARHTRQEFQTIQEIHDTMAAWGAVCEVPRPYPIDKLAVKAGAKHSRSDLAAVQTIHNLTLKLGATCPRPRLYPVWAEPQKALIYKANNQGAMVALFLPPEKAGQYALPAGIVKDSTPPNELHLTLCYLGQAEELSDYQKLELQHGIMTLASLWGPIAGHINGVGRFCNGPVSGQGTDEGDPFFIIPDLPALVEFRDDLLTQIALAGIKLPGDHGYTPHITLAYIEHDSPNPFNQLERAAIEFPHLSLVFGEDRYDYAFLGGRPYAQKSQADAPNYRPTHWARRCENCTFFGGQDGIDDTCRRFDFVADLDYVCDDWSAQNPDEIPGFEGKSLAEVVNLVKSARIC